MNTQNDQLILSLTVQNKPGALFKISGLIRKHRLNIENLILSATENPDISLMTVSIRGNSDSAERMRKQLNRLVEVINVNEN